ISTHDVCIALHGGPHKASNQGRQSASYFQWESNSLCRYLRHSDWARWCPGSTRKARTSSPLAWPPSPPSTSPPAHLSRASSARSPSSPSRPTRSFRCPRPTPTPTIQASHACSYVHHSTPPTPQCRSPDKLCTLARSATLSHAWHFVPVISSPRPAF